VKSDESVPKLVTPKGLESGKTPSPVLDSTPVPVGDAQRVADSKSPELTAAVLRLSTALCDAIEEERWADARGYAAALRPMLRAAANASHAKVG